MNKILIFSFSFILLCFSTQAQDSLVNISYPTLNGTKVNGFSGMRSPFNNSQAYFQMGIGESERFTTEGVPVGDSTIFNLRNALLYTSLSIGYQQKIKDWISIYGRFNISARLGTGVESIIVQGVNTIEGAEFGVSFKLAEGKKFRLAGYTKLHRVEVEIINVREYIVDLILGDPYAAVQKTVPAQNIGGGILFGIAPFNFLSFSMDGSLSYGETVERHKTIWMYDIQGSLDLALKPLLNVPINLLFGAGSSTMISIYTSTGDYSLLTQAKIMYTGSDAFSIGLELFNAKSPISDDRHIRLQGGQFTCNFYFNK
ncbi:MAG: hypothetical protein JXR07_03090 [Reichenbachiella sp.]